MRIIHLSNTDSGGAIELHAALLEHGVDSSMLVAKHDLGYVPNIFQVNTIHKIKSVTSNIISQKIIGALNKQYGMYSLPLWSGSISRHKLVKNADIIYLHFIAHASFISIHEIKQLLKLGKPVIFITRDMWPITGGCHTFFDCEKYKDTCEDCPCLLKKTRLIDIARNQQKKKQEIFGAYNNLWFVGISNWNAQILKQSTIAKNMPIVTIHNCIDTAIFKVADRQVARQNLGLPLAKKLIGFGARKITDPRKGYNYIERALNVVKTKSPNDFALVTFGHTAGFKFNIPGIEQFDLGMISNRDTLAAFYNSIDFYVNPTLFENFGNTAAESLSCGTPVVGFKTGGLMDIIDHQQTGYLAKVGDAEDLAKGILEFIGPTGENKFREHCSAQAQLKFSRSVIAEKHFKLMNTVLAAKVI